MDRRRPQTACVWALAWLAGSHATAQCDLAHKSREIGRQMMAERYATERPVAVKYERLPEPISRNCNHCGREYEIRSNLDAIAFPKFCARCSMDYGKVVYKCSICGVLHFHNFGHCSVCPGHTIRVFVFAKDGSMDSESRVKAWKEAGENNPGKW